jgi:hypothetical protein
MALISMQAPCHICGERNLSEFRAVEINGQKSHPEKLTKIVHVEHYSSKLGSKESGPKGPGFD